MGLGDRRAKEVMDTDIVLASAQTSFDSFLSDPDHQGRLRHVVVTEGNRILGVLRVNTALRQAQAAGSTGVFLGTLASKDFTIVREDDLVFDVIQRIWRKHAVMALVMRGGGVPRPQNVAGAITKEHVADSVAASVKIYPG